MENENEILELLETGAGKAAPYVTERLRSIGDGKMIEGIKAAMKYAYEKGKESDKKKVLMTGLGIGTAGTLFVGGIIIIVYDFYKGREEQVNALQQVNLALNAETAQTDAEHKQIQEDTENKQ